MRRLLPPLLVDEGVVDAVTEVCLTPRSCTRSERALQETNLGGRRADSRGDWI